MPRGASSSPHVAVRPLGPRRDPRPPHRVGVDRVELVQPIPRASTTRTPRRSALVDRLSGTCEPGRPRSPPPRASRSMRRVDSGWTWAGGRQPTAAAPPPVPRRPRLPARSRTYAMRRPPAFRASRSVNASTARPHRGPRRARAARTPGPRARRAAAGPGPARPEPSRSPRRRAATSQPFGRLIAAQAVVWRWLGVERRGHELVPVGVRDRSRAAASPPVAVLRLARCSSRARSSTRTGAACRPRGRAAGPGRPPARRRR